MALPKEPRQKMINMMYLVLTALLALNVSSEILNAFKTVNNSLASSNGVIDQANTGIANSMAEMLKDNNQREKAAIWKPKADSALAFTKEMSDYLEDLKTELKQEAGLNAEGIYKEDNLEAATRMFETNKKGDTLLQKLTQFRDQVLSVLPANMRESMKAALPIDLEKPKTQNAGNNTWSAAYFRMTPAIAGITILSKFQNDVKRSGNLVANECMKQVGQVVLRMNKFEPLVSQNTEYTLPGQKVVITAGLGAFSTENLPQITINGVSRPVDPATGSATWETTAGGGGDQSVKVVVTFTDPNTGEKKTAEKTVKYTVGQPSGASIFLEKMNVMYMDVANPVTVSSGSGKAERTTVSFSAGSVSNKGGGRYEMTPSAQGPATVTINVDGKPYSFPIRVKQLPDPVPLVGSMSGGKMPAAQFKAMGGLRAQLKDSEFEYPFAVVSYTMAGNGAGFPGYTPATVNGAQWGNNAVISQCKPGSTVFFDDIIVRGPGGKTRKLPSIAFQLQ
ncbi:MAG TPA: gliding motility protein GldM [Phnomibacter sp.]|nr:gliding motility protein GldM [Phnomibacter sp.]